MLVGIQFHALYNPSPSQSGLDEYQQLIELQGHIDSPNALPRKLKPNETPVSSRAKPVLVAG